MRTKVFISLAIFAAAVLSPASYAAPVLNYQFKSETPLASGNWIKISTDATGLYEISYETLKKMGFSNPEKVGVFGRLKNTQQYNFIDRDKSILFEDTPVALSVWHSNNKLYFYGLGPEDITAAKTGSGNAIKMCHTRTARNIYSDTTYYYLTDSQPITTVEKHCVADKSNATEASEGYAYIYHEKDSIHGYFSIGQEFWGENITTNAPLEFEVSAPYCVDKPSFLKTRAVFYYGQSGSLTTSVNDGAITSSTSYILPEAVEYGNANENAKLKIDNNHIGKAKIKYELSGSYHPQLPLYLDYWTLSYPISLKYAQGDKDFTQQYISFLPGLGTTWKHPLPEGSKVWDITDRKAPVELDAENGYFYNDNQKKSEIIVFNPSRRQLQIGEKWSKVEIADIHSQQTEPYEMVIFTTNDYLAQSKKIARLHEQYDGFRTLVLTCSEVFNEFNVGMPDAIAYRAVTKMLYQNGGGKLKHVLFVGPIYADYRGAAGRTSDIEGHIAYQQERRSSDLIPTTMSPAISNPMDYYGSVTDYHAYPRTPSSMPITLSVGLINATSQQDADNCVAKIEEYLKKQDFSNIVNESLGFSCSGDDRLHTRQSNSMAELLQDIQGKEFNTSFNHTEVWPEAIGDAATKSLILESLRSGKVYTWYFGHATTQSITGLTASDMASLDNKEPGFMFLMGCDLVIPDQQIHGIGDAALLRSRHGAMGVITSTRQVQADNNEYLGREFMKRMFVDADGNPRTESPSIGEVYAITKDNIANESDPVFLLFGDPALRMPLALGNIEVNTDRIDYLPGEIVKVSGSVLKQDGTPDEDYNGFATVKLFAPSRDIELYRKANSDKTQPEIVDYLTIEGERLGTVKGKVKNGKFEITIPLGKELSSHLSSVNEKSGLIVKVGTYDPKQRRGASGSGEIVMATNETEPNEANMDKKAPNVSLSYNNNTRMVNVMAFDDTALLPGIGNSGGVTLSIDDEAVNITSAESQDVAIKTYNTSVSVAHLAIGNHQVKAYATDICGNKSQSTTLNFTIEDKSTLELKATSIIAIDEIGFEIVGTTTEKLVIMISDIDGNMAKTFSIDSMKPTIDTSDLKAGRYRAVVHADSAAGAYIYSNPVEFTVID